MANEFVHASQGTTLTQAEFEAVGLHVCNSQATGDLIYASSATQLSRLAIGAADTVLTCNGTIPAWSTTPILNTAVAKGTWTASGTWTIPAVTLGGAVTGGNQNLNSIGRIGFGNDASDSSTGIFTSYVEVEPGANKAGVDIGIYGRQTSAATSRIVYGGWFTTGHDGSNTQNWTNALAFQGVLGYINLAGSGTVTGGASLVASAEIAAASTFTNRYGLYINETAGAGTLTNQYGIYIADLTKGGTLDYGIYIAGADTNAIFIAADDLCFGGSKDSAAVADQVSLGGYEIGGGNRVLAISQETAVAADADETKFSNKLQCRINGATYFIMLTAT